MLVEKIAQSAYEKKKKAQQNDCNLFLFFSMLFFSSPLWNINTSLQLSIQYLCACLISIIFRVAFFMSLSLTLALSFATYDVPLMLA